MHKINTFAQSEDNDKQTRKYANADLQERYQFNFLDFYFSEYREGVKG